MESYMESIIKLVIIAFLMFITYILYNIFGERELKKVPGGMVLLSANPALRYLFYALGGFLFVFVAAMMILCYLDGGYENADNELFIYQGISLVLPCTLFVCGYILYAKHVFFNNEYLIIGRPFRSSVKMRWYEIGRMELIGKEHFILYNRDGEVCVNADSNMINYSLFYSIAKEHCRPY